MEPTKAQLRLMRKHVEKGIVRPVGGEWITARKLVMIGWFRWTGIGVYVLTDAGREILAKYGGGPDAD